jgi:pimeloyl-ACP methyl ester carboxylesterase
MSHGILRAPTAAEERAHHRLAAELAGMEIPRFVAPEHRHVVLRGMRFHYLDWGEPGLLPALFLHGGVQTARTWDLPCLALRSDLHCLALDQRGHGDSEWSQALDYSGEAHAGDVEALLDHLAIERAVVVGMSMGCLNGLHFAARQPDRVAAFVAVDAGPWIRLEGSRRITDFVRDADGEAELETWVARALRFNPRRDPRLLRTSLLHNLRELPDGALTWKTDRRRPICLEEMEARLAELRRLLSRLRLPVLILRGAESDVFLDEHAERFADALPDARWVRIEGAGHAIQGDRPGALVREIRGFLDERGLSNPGGGRAPSAAAAR